MDGHPGAIAIDSDSPTLPVDYVVEGARVLQARRASNPPRGIEHIVVTHAIQDPINMSVVRDCTPSAGWR